MYCDCTTSRYCYEPVRHVVTGVLTIIKDTKLLLLVMKGPSYREQNYINWRVNKDICTEVVAAYTLKCSRKEKVDIRVLGVYGEQVH